MPNDSRTLGPVADRVARNVRDLRTAAGLRLDDLSRRLDELGQPVGLGALSKLELGHRRVDVDDLLALAVALGVSPNRLLMPGTADEPVSVTPALTWDGADAWAWACGEAPAPDPDVILDTDRTADFQAANRPHDPGERIRLRELRPHRAKLTAASEAVDKVGLPRAAVLGYLALQTDRRH